MRAALVAHDEVLRSAIEAHDGFLVQPHRDGVVAAFGSPMSAVDAAIAAQRALELPVRMGIATGEAELRDGDYFGAVLNRAARVMAAGHGGQILVADSTAVLLSGSGSGGSGDEVVAGRRRRRSGCFKCELQVCRRTFRRCGQSTRVRVICGHDHEPDRARVRGRRCPSGLVFTSGSDLDRRRWSGQDPPCNGSRDGLADEFLDGVWVFELAAVADPAAVPDAVTAVLGITQQAGMSVAESVASALEGRVSAPVFDNCEHVRDAAADLIEAILAQSATVRILATSREGLGVTDEQLWPVPSLDVGAGMPQTVRRACSQRGFGFAGQCRRRRRGRGDLPSARRDPASRSSWQRHACRR